MSNTTMVTDGFLIYKLVEAEMAGDEAPLFVLDGDGQNSQYLTLDRLKDLRDGLEEFISRYEASRAPDLEF